MHARLPVLARLWLPCLSLFSASPKPGTCPAPGRYAQIPTWKQLWEEKEQEALSSAPSEEE